MGDDSWDMLGKRACTPLEVGTHIILMPTKAMVVPRCLSDKPLETKDATWRLQVAHRLCRQIALRTGFTAIEA